jgi:hypothetical protein
MPSHRTVRRTGNDAMFQVAGLVFSRWPSLRSCHRSPRFHRIGGQGFAGSRRRDGLTISPAGRDSEVGCFAVATADRSPGDCESKMRSESADGPSVLLYTGSLHASVSNHKAKPQETTPVLRPDYLNLARGFGSKPLINFTKCHLRHCRAKHTGRGNLARHSRPGVVCSDFRECISRESIDNFVRGGAHAWQLRKW